MPLSPYRQTPEAPPRRTMLFGLRIDEKERTMQLVARGVHPTHGEPLAEIFRGKTSEEVATICATRTFGSPIKLDAKWDAHLHHVGGGVIYLCPQGTVRCVVCCQDRGWGYTVFHTVRGPCCLVCWERPALELQEDAPVRRPWWQRLRLWLRLA
jgi:hypothetical protein